MLRIGCAAAVSEKEYFTALFQTGFTEINPFTEIRCQGSAGFFHGVFVTVKFGVKKAERVHNDSFGYDLQKKIYSPADQSCKGEDKSSFLKYDEKEEIN